MFRENFEDANFGFRFFQWFWNFTVRLYKYIHFFMMTSSNENIFRVTGLLCGEFTGHRWIPHAKASDEGVWCFLWFAPRINGCVNNHDDVIVMNIRSRGSDTSYEIFGKDTWMVNIKWLSLRSRHFQLPKNCCISIHWCLFLKVRLKISHHWYR